MTRAARRQDQTRSRRSAPAEDKTCDASTRAAKKFSAVRATNLEDLVLKARYVSKDGVENDLGVVAESIMDDLLAMEVESINRATRRNGMTPRLRYLTLKLSRAVLGLAAAARAIS